MDINDTQFTLLQCVIAHPEEQPSLRELKEMNPSLDSDTIREELRELVSYGVVDMDGESQYRLTQDGREDLEGIGIFDAEDTLQHYYARTE